MFLGLPKNERSKDLSSNLTRKEGKKDKEVMSDPQQIAERVCR